MSPVSSLAVLAFSALVLAVNFVQGAKYTVWVGFEQVSIGLEVIVMRPEVLRIHKGDTVVFKQMSFDPHTVTFHPGMPLPDLLINGDEVNPLVATRTVFNGSYDGSTFANSGVMMKGSPLTQYKLTFSTVGEFKYACAVHGPSQNGSIVVVEKNVKIASPKDIQKRLERFKKNALKKGAKLYRKALKTVPKSIKNADGNRTHYVRVGFAEGAYELMQFFPRIVQASPGDIVEYYGSVFHTVTFLNGAPLPDVFVFDPVRGKLVFNSAVLFPANISNPITREGFMNSGLVTNPTVRIPLTVGNIHGRIRYVCIPHYASGMRGFLEVKKRKPSKKHG